MLLPSAPIFSCLKAFFDSYDQVPVGQIYRTHTLVRQRVDLDDLDDVVGKKTGHSYGCDEPLSTVASLEPKASIQPVIADKADDSQS